MTGRDTLTRAAAVVAVVAIAVWTMRREILAARARRLVDLAYRGRLVDEYGW